MSVREGFEPCLTEVLDMSVHTPTEIWDLILSYLLLINLSMYSFIYLFILSPELLTLLESYGRAINGQDISMNNLTIYSSDHILDS